MALQDRELFTSQNVPAEPRVQPAVVKVRVFASAVGDPVLARLSPVTYNGTQFISWTDGAQIDGFVWSDNGGLQLSAAGEVNGVVMLAGRIDVADVPLPAGQTQGALDTALNATLLRQKGIYIEGSATAP